MNKHDSSEREAQPWHEEDEKSPTGHRKGAPIGTHSLTGGDADVGMPRKPKAEHGVERGSPRDMPPGGSEPDALAEPRAGNADLLGRKG